MNAEQRNTTQVLIGGEGRRVGWLIFWIIVIVIADVTDGGHVPTSSSQLLYDSLRPPAEILQDHCQQVTFAQLSKTDMD